MAFGETPGRIIQAEALMGAAEAMAAVAVQGLLAAGMVEALIRLWRVETPEQVLQLRRIALALPVLVSAASWAAGLAGLSPRAAVLFDVGRWLALPLPAGMQLGLVAGAMGVACVTLFASQELFPTLRRHHALIRETRPYRSGELPALDAALSAVTSDFGGQLPSVWMAGDGGPMACMAGSRRLRLLVSRRLVALLAPEELRAALAHEAAHALRRDLGAGWVWFGLRALQCFSPAALLEFRWTLRDQERACDRVAAGRTGEPRALASALWKVHAATAPPRPPEGLARFLVQVGTAWEERMVECRLEDLLRGEPLVPVPWWRWRLVAAGCAVVGVLALVR